MAHFSRFIPRGSVRVAASNDTATGLWYTAAVTPDEELIVVVSNPQDNNLEHYQLKIGNQYVHMNIHSHSIQTVQFPLKSSQKVKAVEKDQVNGKTVHAATRTSTPSTGTFISVRESTSNYRPTNDQKD